MVRKNRQQNQVKIEKTANPPDNDTNNSSDDDLKCRYCNLIFATSNENEIHESGCPAKPSASVIFTSGDKTRFLCTVSIPLVQQEYVTFLK